MSTTRALCRNANANYKPVKFVCEGDATEGSCSIVVRCSDEVYKVGFVHGDFLSSM